MNRLIITESGDSGDSMKKWPRSDSRLKYIFIVGLPRTGTKLMKNIVEKSPNVSCRISHENFFLGHQSSAYLRPGVRHYIKKIGNMFEDSNVEKLVDLMYSGKFVGTYWKMLKNGRLNIDRNRFLNEILGSDRSERSIYEIIMKIHSIDEKIDVFGDRTPSHLFHLPLAMDWFPDSKTIHTVRDPRAIAASQLKRLLERSYKKHRTRSDMITYLYSFVIVTHTIIGWFRAVKLDGKYKKKYPHRYYFSKFESIVENPETSIRSLCAFLDIDFDQKMLTPHVVDSSFSQGTDSGIDKNTTNRWKYYLKPWMNKMIVLCLFDYMKAYGYTDYNI